MNEDYFIEAGFDIITGENEMSPEDFAEMQARKAPSCCFNYSGSTPSSDFSGWDDSQDMPF